MEKIILDSAIKFGAGRYRQEKDFWKNVERRLQDSAKKHFLLRDRELLML